MKTKINIPWAQPCFWGDEQRFVTDALRSSWISGGPFVQRFEKELAKHHGVPFCITTSNGTTALQLALMAAGVGPGDEVIVPGFSFLAPANMVLGIGAKPVYADIDPATWCMDPACVKAKISRKTKAIVAVHNYGNVCDMNALRGLAKRRGLFLIEDVAEALFSKYNGQLAGTFGDIGCFSFQATKTITMGEGGCVLTSNKKLHRLMRLIRDHGMPQRGRYWHEVLGYNFRLTNLQAALGCAQFKYRLRIIAAKRKVYSLYRKYLKGQKGIRFQLVRREVRPVIWTVAVEIDPSVFNMKRDEAIRCLAAAGIETRPGFIPASLMPLYHAPSLPTAERISARVLCLPSFPGLKESEIKRICGQLKKLSRKTHG
ncbi:MAG TPA: DegT/DnrJ/EryC1/StrS family aminotransferase [Candidatus Omnitrophota bacterium]|nr:DegT/DnrJ/EryC1/StrS family aminotransferase [Candidatus Omnitrophota bacterium]